MKTIDILSIDLQNFKGARDLHIEFNKETNILGDNSSYKTTVFDGFKWLLFDKDSTDRKDFEIKTLDKNNNVITGLEHTVTGVLNIDGIKKTLQKIYKEKWQKPRGQAESIYTGNETLYYINDRPLLKKDYEKEISEFADETVFKLLTDPLYFSSSKFPWEKRRKIITQICGDVTPEEVIASKAELKDLKDLFAEEKDIKKIQQTLANQRKRYNEDIKNISPRIDECNKSIKDLDFEKLEADLKFFESELDAIEADLLKAIKTDPEREEKENSLKSIQRELSNIKLKADTKQNEYVNNLRQRLSKLESDLRTANNNLNIKERELTNEMKKLAEYEKEIDQYREDYMLEKEKELSLNN